MTSKRKQRILDKKKNREEPRVKTDSNLIKTEKDKLNSLDRGSLKSSLTGLGAIITPLIIAKINDSIDVENTVMGMIDQYQNECPTTAELEPVLNQLNGLKSKLNSVSAVTKQVDTMISPLRTILNITNVSISIIENLPIPTSVPPGIGIPVNVPVKFADTLRILKELVKGTSGEITNINQLSNSMSGFVTKPTLAINLLSSVLEQCVIKNTNLTDEQKVNLVKSIQKNEDKSLDIGQKQSKQEYKGYTYEIQSRIIDNLPIPQRRIKATSGNDSIYGEWSYSATTDIMVKELKFAIDSKGKSPNYYFSKT